MSERLRRERKKESDRAKEKGRLRRDRQKARVKEKQVRKTKKERGERGSRSCSLDVSVLHCGSDLKAGSRSVSCAESVWRWNILSALFKASGGV